MNWLAHLYLSPPHVEVRLGSVIADWVKGGDRAHFDHNFQIGFVLHQKVDLFTDQHDVVKRSQARIRPPFMRFAGVLVDVFYDHFLARDWAKHTTNEQTTSTTLHQFTQTLYAQFAQYPHPLNERIRTALNYMASDDWLGSYAHINGIEEILKRMSRRLFSRTNRANLLGAAIGELTHNYAALDDDFCDFWPQLQAYVNAQIAIVESQGYHSHIDS
jgi:acyl carrier protein phosphodiesterase